MWLSTKVIYSLAVTSDLGDICQMERTPICGTVTLTLSCYPNHLPGIPGRCYIMKEAFETIKYWPVYVKWLTSFNEKTPLPKLASFIHTLAFFDWLNLSPSLSSAWPPYKPGVLSHLHTLDPTASLHSPPPRLILPRHSHARSRKAAMTNQPPNLFGENDSQLLEFFYNLFEFVS